MDAGQMTLALAPSALPTLMVLFGILVNNRQIDVVGHRIDGLGKRIDDTGKRIDDMGKRIDDLRFEMLREFENSRRLFTEQLRRVEDVISA